MRYNTNIKGRKEDYNENNAMIRKNYSQMNNKEIKYLFDRIKSLNINSTRITAHAIEKKLLSLEQIKNNLIKNNFDIIDFNYFIDTKEQRIMIRLKNIYRIIGKNGREEKCFIKVVISLTDNKIITIWGTKVKDEEERQRNICTRYTNFNILSLK